NKCLLEWDPKREAVDRLNQHRSCLADVPIEVKADPSAICERNGLELAFALPVSHAELLVCIAGLLVEPLSRYGKESFAFALRLVFEIELPESRIDGLGQHVSRRSGTRVRLDIQSVDACFLVGKHDGESQGAASLAHGGTNGIEHLTLIEFFTGDVRNAFALLHESQQGRLVQKACHMNEIVDEVAV